MGANWDENNKDYQKANARKHSIKYREAIRKYLHNYLLSHPCVSCVETSLLFWSSIIFTVKKYDSPDDDKG